MQGVGSKAFIVNLLPMVDRQLPLRSKLGIELFRSLSAHPLSVLCQRQISDACLMIDLCHLRTQDNGSNRDFGNLCIQTSRQEEVIYQYASDHRSRLADWVRQYSKCDYASDFEAHTAYIMACAVKALGALVEWMNSTHKRAWSHVAEPPTDWPWDLYCNLVEKQVDPDERVHALEQYTLYLEPITSLPCLSSDELAPIACKAIEIAIRKKGGIISSMERDDEVRARNAAIAKQAGHYLISGMPARNIASATHAWLIREVGKSPEHSPQWVTPERGKALTRKSVEAILKRYLLL